MPVRRRTDRDRLGARTVTSSPPSAARSWRLDSIAVSATAALGRELGRAGSRSKDVRTRSGTERAAGALARLTALVGLSPRPVRFLAARLCATSHIARCSTASEGGRRIPRGREVPVVVGTRSVGAPRAWDAVVRGVDGARASRLELRLAICRRLEQLDLKQRDGDAEGGVMLVLSDSRTTAACSFDPR